MVVRSRGGALWASPSSKLLRWSLMSAALFWMVVYRLSSAAAGLPDFVYVQF